MTLSQSHVVVDNTLKLPFENPVKINLIQLIETFHTIAHCLWDVVMFVKYVGEKNFITYFTNIVYVCENFLYVSVCYVDFKTLADRLCCEYNHGIFSHARKFSSGGKQCMFEVHFSKLNESSIVA